MENDKATQEWLDAQKSGTKSTYKTVFKHFLRYANLSGDAILTDRKKDTVFAWEKRVLESKTWAIEQGMAENTATLIATSARSFFAYHRVPLQFRRGEKAKLKETKTVQENYRFSIEDLKKMYDVGDLQERYVLLTGKSFGLRAGDFMHLTRGDLEAYIDRETPISIGEYHTQKEGVKAFPFIDSDAQPVIKLMLDKMTRDGKVSPNERILSYSAELQLTRVLKRLIEKAGINVGNKRVRFHCLRKFLIDRLSDVMSESKWKQVVGKVVPESAYVSADALREDYQRATTATCFSKQTGSQEMEKLAQKQALLMIAKNSFGMNEEQVKNLLIRYASRKPMLTIADEITALEEIIEEKRESAKTEQDGCGTAFKQITENETLTHLREGWRIVKELKSGEVIVSR